MDSIGGEKMSIRHGGLAVALVLAFLVSGCATVPMADPQQDKVEKSFAAVPGKSKIYIYRNETFGAAITMDVSIDDRLLGSTGSKTYLVAVVEPGAHQIRSKGENEEILSLSTVAGRVYYVWQEIKMGLFMARSALREVDEKTGQAGVLESQLIAPRR
jgi:hypothetical protein